MVRIILRISPLRRGWLLLAPLAVMILCAAVAPERQSGAAVDAALAGIRQRFFLTKTYYSPNEAPAACGRGYHMASLWELYDPSNLDYDRDHPAAYVQADIGHGPPSNSYGWIRTGYINSGSNKPGQGNCQNWTSTSSGYGTSVGLSSLWETSPGKIGPWMVESVACNTIFTRRVWCVSEIQTFYLPEVAR